MKNKMKIKYASLMKNKKKIQISGNILNLTVLKIIFTCFFHNHSFSPNFSSIKDNYFYTKLHVYSIRDHSI